MPASGNSPGSRKHTWVGGQSSPGAPVDDPPVGSPELLPSPVVSPGPVLMPGLTVVSLDVAAPVEDAPSVDAAAVPAVPSLVLP